MDGVFFGRLKLPRRSGIVHHLLARGCKSWPDMIIPPNASGRSSAWLEHLLWEQGVARSNRVAPTILSSLDSPKSRTYLALCILWLQLGPRARGIPDISHIFSCFTVILSAFHACFNLHVGNLDESGLQPSALACGSRRAAAFAQLRRRAPCVVGSLRRYCRAQRHRR